MKDKRFKELLNEPYFLSIYYQARKMNEDDKLGSIANAFLAHGMNKYKHFFFYMCEHWGIKNLVEINEFDELIRNYDGVS